MIKAQPLDPKYILNETEAEAVLKVCEFMQLSTGFLKEAKRLLSKACTTAMFTAFLVTRCNLEHRVAELIIICAMLHVGTYKDHV